MLGKEIYTHIPNSWFFSPDIDVRRKALDIAMDMISSRNVQEVVLVLKKELVKTHDQEYEKVTYSQGVSPFAIY